MRIDRCAQEYSTLSEADILSVVMRNNLWSYVFAGYAGIGIQMSQKTNRCAMCAGRTGRKLGVHDTVIVYLSILKPYLFQFIYQQMRQIKLPHR